MPTRVKDDKPESIDDRNVFVKAYFASRKLLGMDKEVLVYDYSVLSKSKDSEKD